MPDKKKVVVKVLKKSTPKMEEAVPKGMTKGGIDKINETTKFNAKSIATEARAKGDSVSGAKKAKLMGMDIVDQRRAGNVEANKTRVKEGNPQVLRGRTMTKTSDYTDKYAPDGNAPSVDSYQRMKPLEKDMPVVKKTMVKVKKK